MRGLHRRDWRVVEAIYHLAEVVAVGKLGPEEAAAAVEEGSEELQNGRDNIQHTLENWHSGISKGGEGGPGHTDPKTHPANCVPPSLLHATASTAPSPSPDLSIPNRTQPSVALLQT